SAGTEDARGFREHGDVLLVGLEVPERGEEARGVIEACCRERKRAEIGPRNREMAGPRAVEQGARQIDARAPQPEAGKRREMAAVAAREVEQALSRRHPDEPGPEASLGLPGGAVAMRVDDRVERTERRVEPGQRLDFRRVAVSKVGHACFKPWDDGRARGRGRRASAEPPPGCGPSSPREAWPRPKGS